MRETERVRQEYGFTNERIWMDRAIAWRDAAVNDGWTIEPTYPNHESVDRASSLQKEGFHAMILTRDNSGQGKKYAMEAHVSLWGPDGMGISAPDIYDWQAVQKGTTHCPVCGANDVHTFHYSFAGRACEKCLPAMKKKHEYPGWCD